MTSKVLLLSEKDIQELRRVGMSDLYEGDVDTLLALARWAAVMHDVVVDYLKNEDERLAMTHAFAKKKISREAWMDHGPIADRRRKAVEANMRALLAEIDAPETEERS